MASLFDGTSGKDDIGEIYRLMQENCPNPWSHSEWLWKLRRATHISDHSERQETMLEKAVAMLAKNNHLPGWYNQCPAASGIGDSSRNRGSRIDLVHWSETDKQARLIELKWYSDSPYEAVQQILRYGAAYAFCRWHKSKLRVQDREIMHARHVSLQVAAPAPYSNSVPLDCLSQAREGLKKFETELGIEAVSMSLDVLALPEWFDDLPFSNGAEVSATCNRKDLTEEGRAIRDAFDGLTSVYPE